MLSTVVCTSWNFFDLTLSHHCYIIILHSLQNFLSYVIQYTGGEVRAAETEGISYSQFRYRV